jgi:hypothetical protein
MGELAKQGLIPEPAPAGVVFDIHSIGHSSD